MDHIRQMEALFSIFLASFEMQINTLHVLKGHRIRSDIINHTKKLVQALLRTIESIESEFTSEIEGEAEVTLGQSALLVSTLAKAKKRCRKFKFYKNFVI